MADREHPKTHAKPGNERKQPLSPQHEGIDPLTEADTLKSREDVKANAEKFHKAEEKEATEQLDSGEASETDQKTADTVADQKAVEADTSGSDTAEESAAQPKATTDSKSKTSSK